MWLKNAKCHIHSRCLEQTLFTVSQPFHGQDSYKMPSMNPALPMQKVATPNEPLCDRLWPDSHDCGTPGPICHIDSMISTRLAKENQFITDAYLSPFLFPDDHTQRIRLLAAIRPLRPLTHLGPALRNGRVINAVISVSLSAAVRGPMAT